MTDANTLTPTDAATAGMEPVATVLFSSTGWRTLVDALASLEDGTKLYTAAQVQAMLAAAPVGMEPVYQIGQPFLFDPENTWRDASKDAYDVCMPNRRRIIYTASQVHAMLAAVPRNAPLYSPDDVAFPVQRSADGTDALPPELTSIAKQASTAAAKKGGQHGF